jgi:hypothetical protein
MTEELYKFAKRRKLLKLSEAIIQLIYDEIDLPFELWIRESYPRSKNIYCEINCIICNQQSRISTKHLAKRTLIKEEICMKCGNNEVYKRIEWIKANSEAQKKIQSTPEQKLKNSQGVTRFWNENPEKKEQVRQKLLSYYEDPKYKKMVAKSRGKIFHALAGEYKFRNKNWIEFESSYELCFLIWLESQNEYHTIRKCKFYIEYEYEGRIRYYYPDFVIMNNNEKIIVELKSTKPFYYDEKKNTAKIKATENFINRANFDRYWFIEENEAQDIGLIFKRSSKIKPLCKKLFRENKIKLFSKEKERRYIGEVSETKE